MLAAIEKRRQRIRSLIADVKQIDAAPYPSALAKQRAREEIEQLAERGTPCFDALVEQYQGKIRWPEIQLDFNVGLATPRALDSNGLLACLLRDQLIALSERKIDEIKDDDNALTDAQRGEKFKDLLGELLSMERDEEALIHAATFDVDRRADADPRAVLGLSSELPGPKRDLVHRRLIFSVETVTSVSKPAWQSRMGTVGIDVHRMPKSS